MLFRRFASHEVKRTIFYSHIPGEILNCSNIWPSANGVVRFTFLPHFIFLLGLKGRSHGPININCIPFLYLAVINDEIFKAGHLYQHR